MGVLLGVSASCVLVVFMRGFAFPCRLVCLSLSVVGKNQLCESGRAVVRRDFGLRWLGGSPSIPPAPKCWVRTLQELYCCNLAFVGMGCVGVSRTVPGVLVVLMVLGATCAILLLNLRSSPLHRCGQGHLVGGGWATLEEMASKHAMLVSGQEPSPGE